MKTDNEYIPYGVEWKDELMKLPKIAIIALYRSLCLKEQERNESSSQLPANEITDEEIKQKIIDTIKRYDEFVPKHELEMLSKKAGISIDEYCRIAVAEKITYWLHSQSKATPIDKTGHPNPDGYFVSQPVKEAQEIKCVAGCKMFTGGEILHHKDCPFYPDSLSRIYNEMKDTIAQFTQPDMHDTHVDFLAYLYENKINIRDIKVNWQKLMSIYPKETVVLLTITNKLR